MREFFSKKMVLTLTAGMLVVVVAFAGISAWFTGTATTGDNSFETAIVAVKESGNEIWVNNFFPGDTVTLNAQRDLENGIIAANGDPVLKNQALASWWNYYSAVAGGDAGSNFYISNDGTIPEVEKDKIKFIVNPTVLAGNVASNVTPGSFLYATYKFESESTIPVYARVKQPEVADEVTVEVAYIAWPGGNILLVDGKDGYFYCPVPIDAYDASATDPNEISIMFAIYFPGAENGNDLQNTTVSFEGTEEGIEVIQATNNAVYLADGWKDAAVYVNFIPYTDSLI